MGANRLLNEASLSEADGVCMTNGHPIDWNANGHIDTATVSVDINPDYAATCGGALTSLHDYADWSHVSLAPVHLYAPQALTPDAVSPDCPPPPESEPATQD